MGEGAQSGQEENNSELEMAGKLDTTEATTIFARLSTGMPKQTPATGTGGKAISEQELTESSREEGRGLPGTLKEIGSETEEVFTEVGMDFPASREAMEGPRHEEAGERADMSHVEAEEPAMVRWCDATEAPGTRRADTIFERASRNEGSSMIVREDGKCAKEKTWDAGPIYK